MDYADVNKQYLKEVECLSLLGYAVLTKQKDHRLYEHLGYNYNLLDAVGKDDCSAIPVSTCEQNNECSLWHNADQVPHCVTKTRKRRIKNNGVIFTSVPGDANVLRNATFYVVDAGIMSGSDINLLYEGRTDISFYYKIYLSKHSGILYCIFNLGRENRNKDRG